MPIRNQPLPTKFQGQFSVLEKIIYITYVSNIPRSRKKKTVVHINFFKKYLPYRLDAAGASCVLSGPKVSEIRRDVSLVTHGGKLGDGATPVKQEPYGVKLST